MGFWARLTLIVLAVLAFFYVKTSFFTGETVPRVEKKLVEEEQVVQEVKNVQEPDNPKVKAPKTDEINLYFLGSDSEGSTIFKTVRRELPAGKTSVQKIEYALGQLISGPSKYEKGKGVYSEIPKTTKLLSVSDNTDYIILQSKKNLALRQYHLRGRL